VIQVVCLNDCAYIRIYSFLECSTVPPQKFWHGMVPPQFMKHYNKVSNWTEQYINTYHMWAAANNTVVTDATQQQTSLTAKLQTRINTTGTKAPYYSQPRWYYCTTLLHEPPNCRWAPSSACWRLSFSSMREPSSGAVVTEQRVRRRIQISGLNSTQHSQLCVQDTPTAIAALWFTRIVRCSSAEPSILYKQGKVM